MISAKPMGLSLGNFVGMTSGDDMRRGAVAAAVGERPCPARALAKQHDGLVADALGQRLVAADLIRPGGDVPRHYATASEASSRSARLGHIADDMSSHSALSRAASATRATLSRRLPAPRRSAGPPPAPHPFP